MISTYKFDLTKYTGIHLQIIKVIGWRSKPQLQILNYDQLRILKTIHVIAFVFPRDGASLFLIEKMPNLLQLTLWQNKILPPAICCNANLETFHARALSLSSLVSVTPPIKFTPAQHSSISHSEAVLYSTVLYSTLLYSTLLYSTIRYCTLLYKAGKKWNILLHFFA